MLTPLQALSFFPTQQTAAGGRLRCEDVALVQGVIVAQQQIHSTNEEILAVVHVPRPRQKLSLLLDELLMRCHLAVAELPCMPHQL